MRATVERIEAGLHRFGGGIYRYGVETSCGGGGML